VIHYFVVHVSSINTKSD